MNMHLTDRMLCPRCGPPFGLILLAEESDGGRVIKGRLGCPNCRERYEIAAAVADLRPPPRRALPAPGPRSGGDPEAAVRMAALLGVADGPGVVGVQGPGVSHVELLADLAPSVEWAAFHQGLPPSDVEESPATHLILGDVLPFMPHTFRGMVVHGPMQSESDYVDLMRLLIAGGRLLVESPTDSWRERIGEAADEILLDAPQACVVRKT